MKVRILALACLAMTALVSVPSGAQQQSGEDDILNRVISVPNPRAYRVDGTQNGAQSQVRNDSSVLGGKALRVQVPARNAQTWATAVSVPINRAVRSGDNLVLAFWARLEQGDNGATSASLPYNSVQLAAAPYTALFSGGVTVTPAWADVRDHRPGQSRLCRGRAERLDPPRHRPSDHRHRPGLRPEHGAVMGPRK